MAERKEIEPFRSLAEVISFFEHLAESNCATRTLKFVLVQLLAACLAPLPDQGRTLNFSHKLVQSPKRSGETIVIKLENGGFCMEWLGARQGEVLLIRVESSKREPKSLYKFNLLFSDNIPDDLAEIAAWIIRNRPSLEHAAALAAVH